MRSRLSPSRRRSSTKPDFGRVACRYDELRPTDENWWELFELLVHEGDLVGHRVLDIGCGTGRAAAALAERGSRVWGVEPEPEMAALARERLSTVKVARAENLPFKDGWFDRALMWLVAHLVDRPRAFAEARRVLGPDGRLAIATFHWDYFDRHWLGAFFPSLEAIDRARFSKTEELVAELAAAGFASVTHTRLSQQTAVPKESAIERVRDYYVSPLQLLDEDEHRIGLERMAKELPETVEYTLEWLVAVAYR